MEFENFMEFGNFMEFIYLSLIAILVNFPYQLVIVICNPILKDRAPYRNELMISYHFLHNLNECHR